MKHILIEGERILSRMFVKPQCNVKFDGVLQLMQARTVMVVGLADVIVLLNRSIK